MDIIDHIAIKVADLKQAEQWYLEHLRAEITFRDHKYIRLKVGNTNIALIDEAYYPCLLYTSPSPRDATLSRMPSSA